jgi:hypothetical protein
MSLAQRAGASIIKVAGQPLISSGSHQDREARAQTLATLFVKFLSDHVDLVVQVRHDFLNKPAAEKVMGCSTWGEYCKNVLHYSESHIRNLIAGRNPATKIFDGSKNRTTPLITEDAEDISQQPPDSPWRSENHTATTILSDVVELRKRAFGLIPDIDEVIRSLNKATEPDSEFQKAGIDIAEELNTMCNALRDRADKLEKAFEITVLEKTA